MTDHEDDLVDFDKTISKSEDQSLNLAANMETSRPKQPSQHVPGTVVRPLRVSRAVRSK